MTFSCCMSSDVFALPPSSKPQLLNLTYRRLNSLPFSRVHCTLCREMGMAGGAQRRAAATAVPHLHSVDISSPVAVALWAPLLTFSLFVFAWLHVVRHLTLRPSVHPSLGSSVFLADTLNFRGFSTLQWLRGLAAQLGAHYLLTQTARKTKTYCASFSLFLVKCSHPPLHVFICLCLSLPPQALFE